GFVAHAARVLSPTGSDAERIRLKCLAALATSAALLQPGEATPGTATGEGASALKFGATATKASSVFGAKTLLVVFGGGTLMFGALAGAVYGNRGDTPRLESVASVGSDTPPEAAAHEVVPAAPVV